MKKTLTMVMALAGMTAMAVPSYIFFQVDQTGAGYSDYTFDYATVRADGDYLTIGDTSYWQLYANDDGLTTAEIYAGTFDRSYTGNLTFELWTEDGDDPYVATYSYAAWKDYAYADMYQTGATSLIVNALPEPASGLLLLLGLSGLALRRKAGRVLLVLCLPLVTFGSANDTLISFSTKGPDTYLDGTTVKDGECYALVWTKTGATFEGLAADGKAVGSNSQVVVFAPVAKDGCCPPVLFELDAALAKTFTDGSYGVYLLDTRLANGAVGGVNAAGNPVAVNGYGEVKKLSGDGEESVLSSPSNFDSATVAITSKSAIPADAPKPQITAIRLIGDKVFLTVKNTLPCLQYAAKEVKNLGEGDATTSTSVQGASTTDTEITIIAPKKGDSGFYFVGRN